MTKLRIGVGGELACECVRLALAIYNTRGSPIDRRARRTRAAVAIEPVARDEAIEERISRILWKRLAGTAVWRSLSTRDRVP